MITDEDSVLRKSYKHTATKEQPVAFSNMSEIVGKFEKGQDSNSERHRERKQEIQNIRSRLFMVSLLIYCLHSKNQYGKK